MGSYDSFKTDADHERDGVVFDYGQFRYRLARAGGANKKFAKTMERLSRPYRRQIERGAMDEEAARRLLRQVYIQSVILSWELLIDGEWKEGVETADGEVVLGKPSADVLDTLFQDIPELFTQIQEDSGDVRVYLENLAESDAKN